MSYEPVPRWKQLLGGVFIAVVGAGGTAWVWYTALTEGRYNLVGSVALPTVLIQGLVLILLPGYKEVRINRGEDISGLSGLQLLTSRWWLVLVVALAAGFGNLLLLRSGVWQTPPG